LKQKLTKKVTTKKSDSKQVKSKEGNVDSPTRRSNAKYPNLNKSLNTKLRRDYLDNTYYVDGVKKKDEYVIRPLNDDEKEWLNKFNGEYYGASFDKDDENNLHKNLAEDTTIYNIRQDISKLRKLAAKEQDQELAKEYYNELEEQIEYLKEVYPKKKCTDANNERNRCLLNTGKATNEVRFIPWETLDQNVIGELDLELLYILNDMENEDD
jgi:hypothetical protein